MKLIHQASVSTFATIVIFPILMTTLAACSPDSRPTRAPAAEVRGARNYKLDPEANAVQLSIHGVAMGTPDTSKFSYLMRTLKNAGEFVSVFEKDPGGDNGITICGVFSASANRESMYQMLRSLETDAKSTAFSAISVSGCSN